jgi:O-antigen ligase
MVALIAFYNLFEYRLASIAARYTFELLSGRQIFGGHYFVASTIFACSLFMSASSKWRQLFWSIVLVVSALALALTFSRGFWLGALLGIGVLWLLSEGHSRKRLVVAAVVVSGLATLLVWIFAGRLASFIFEALTNRFLSSGSGLEDLSVAERVAESKDAIRAILQSPLVGHGYGATYVHYNTLEKVTVNWFYAHNAYLFVLFKVGLIGFLGFFTFYIMLIRKGWSSIKNRWGTIIDTEFIRASVAVLIGYLFIATNSGIFIDKAAVLVITMCSVLLSLSDKNASSASPPGGQPGSPLSLEPTLHTNP